MKTAIISTLLFLSFSGMAQKLDEKTFDFWVGEWELTWDKPDGTKGKGINQIIKILDNKVIQENFEDPDTGFKGTSISVYNPVKKEWHQAWADNQGGYFDFIGDIGNDGPVFKTKIVVQGDKKIIQRMTFKNITKDKFVWDWENSTDGGENWTLSWRINYNRKK
ncbi:hypothetical protein GTQ40_12125 [Flavobacteriaceae bacterium R38]|nr:hypothetical protein [Flavobacteriaceae bacterium R38]